MTDTVRTMDGLALVGSADEAARDPEPEDATTHRYSLDGLRALARAVRDLKETG